MNSLNIRSRNVRDICQTLAFKRDIIVNNDKKIIGNNIKNVLRFHSSVHSGNKSSLFQRSSLALKNSINSSNILSTRILFGNEIPKGFDRFYRGKKNQEENSESADSKSSDKKSTNKNEYKSGNGNNDKGNKKPNSEGFDSKVIAGLLAV